MGNCGSCVIAFILHALIDDSGESNKRTKVMCTSSYSVVASVVLEQILGISFIMCFSFAGMSECVIFLFLFLNKFFGFL